MHDDKSIKKVLWDNVSALMKAHYGAENLNRLARDAKLGPATVTRIKEMKTSVGLDVIAKIAIFFKVDPWQLLVPGMGDEKFLVVFRAWHDTDGRGRRMLVRAAEGATEDETERGERPAATKLAR